MKQSRSIPAVALIAATLIGCGDDDTTCVDRGGAIAMSVSGFIIADGGTVQVVPLVPTRVVVTNVGAGTVCLRDLAFEPGSDDAITIVSVPWPSPDAPVALAPGDAHELILRYDAEAATPDQAGATVRIQAGETEHVFRARGAMTSLVPTPDELDFGDVAPNTSRSATVSLRNIGPAAVHITRIHLDGPPGYSVTVHGVSHMASYSSARDGIPVSPPLEVDPGREVAIELGFVSESLFGAFGSLRVVTDELPVSSGVYVPLYANVAPPCLTVSPAPLDFGGQPVGVTTTRALALTRCSPRRVVIDDITLALSGDGAFTLDTSALGPLPIVLDGDETREVIVGYTPDALIGPGVEADRGRITIASNAQRAPETVEIVGFGSDGRCPTARVSCGGHHVVPLGSRITCSAAASTSAEGGVVSSYAWAITRPDGSILNSLTRNVDVTTDALGHYTFALDVWDDRGARSCNTATFDVEVLAEGGFQVEVVWTTPGDPNETDSGFTQSGMSLGSDVDLHVLHPNGSAWFDDRWDAYWLNPTPNWAGAGSIDDPAIVRDDTDGGGPELFHYPIPELGKTYAVAVHYWDDWGYGPAEATVRVYVRGDVQFEWRGVPLRTQDMWQVCRIDWPSGEVHALGDGEPVIEPNYPVPLNAGWPF